MLSKVNKAGIKRHKSHRVLIVNDSSLRPGIADLNPPARNLGAYANIFDDVTARDVLTANSEMNFVDKAAYPELTVMEQEVVRFLLACLNGTPGSMGFATSGSSEAIVLALAWHQRNFIARYPELKGQDLNFVISESYHKVFEKYAELFGVELRAAKLKSNLTVDTEDMERLIDKRTFCLVGIAGTTELGKMDDIKGINQLAQTHDLPVHVDAAIGGYVFPFLSDYRQQWDFVMPSVQTINVSGHKYGLCLPAVGFLLVRNQTVIPQSFSKHANIAYLSGGEIVDYALTCSRNAAFVASAYNNFQRYGAKGYEIITYQNIANSDYLAQKLREIGAITDVVQGDIPVVNFTGNHIEELSVHIANIGWIQHPHFILPLQRRYIRVAIRKHISQTMLDELLKDITNYY